MKYFLSHILLFAALLLTSCADDAFVADFTTDNPVDIDIAEPENLDGVYASLPELIDGNAVNDGVVSRSSLTYDRGTKRMKFSWGAVDDNPDMTVFRPNTTQGRTSVSPINFKRKNWTDSAISGSFAPSDQQIQTLAENTSYIAFRPYKVQDFDYDKCDIHFDGQTNANKVKMGAYYIATYDNTKTEDQKNTLLLSYDESEALASSHLGAYDYLVSEPKTTSEAGAVYFPLQRVGVITRFFLKNPAKEVFEQLQLVTQGAPLFTIDGTINLTNKKITPKTQSNVMVLSYGDGVDMSIDTDLDYYYNNAGYMISYMMLAPIDLNVTGAQVHLYLVSHTKTEPSIKKYYKSVSLATPTLTSNMFYQWRSNENQTEDQPITFTEVTFQEWQSGTTISNGDSGTGTEGW